MVAQHDVLRADLLDRLALSIVEESPDVAAAYRTSAASIRAHIAERERCAARRETFRTIVRPLILVGVLWAALISAILFALGGAA